MTSEEVRQRFLEFFKERGHVVVPSSSLIPDDPSVLLTTAGMQQFKRYFTGELDPERDFGSRRTASIQKCFRTSDIESVGDETHTTFFEMLGHFSFGDYFKKETVEWTYEFLTSVLQVPAERIRATMFEGDNTVSSDEESFSAWSRFLPRERIGKGPRADNFWGPAGTEGPCGACNEVYVDDTEVATLVFMEYYCRPDGSLEKLKQKGVDVGWGFERLVRVLQGAPDIFEIDVFHPLLSRVREIAPSAPLRVQRILADHLRAAVFLVADGLRPSNKEAGYILRRLLRRILAYEIAHDIHVNAFPSAVKLIGEKFGSYYPELRNEAQILEVLDTERERFKKSVSQGLVEMRRFSKIDAKVAFTLYESFGLPFELITELAPQSAVSDLKREDFEAEFRHHQDISRAGAEKKFGGHGLILDTGELKAGTVEEVKKVIRLHTATHLLHQALREVLGPEARQMGSDINPERTRFDFSFGRKMTQDEIRRVEKLVNQKIKEDLPVAFAEFPKRDAEKTGALHFFSAQGGSPPKADGPRAHAFGGKEKYPERVKVYYVGHSLDSAWSKEFCGGPHVDHTGEIGHFRIIKEEAIAAGVRRVRGAVEP